MKDSKVLKVIGLSALLIISLLFIGSVIIKFVDNMKIRNILFAVSCVVLYLLMVVLIKAPKAVSWTIGALWGIVIFIGMIVSIVSSLRNFRKPLALLEIPITFEGNNSFTWSYSDGIGAKGYDDIESLMEAEIENRKKTRNLSDDDLEEIYRIQIGEKIFVYLKEDEEELVEFEFFKQNDLYYTSGSKSLLYNGVFSSDSYTAEETIRTDIANTMWRGVGSDEVGAPAWGVSTDENVFSMTINSEAVDDVILIDEKGRKKYYFWITTNVDGIETINDVKAAEIEM